jgi:hypothetical protein
MEHLELLRRYTIAFSCWEYGLLSDYKHLSANVTIGVLPNVLICISTQGAYLLFYGQMKMLY